MDRRVADPGPEEEHGHPEPEEAETLQAQEEARGAGQGDRRDDRRHREQAEKALEMLPAAFAPAPPLGDMDDGGERPCSGAGHPTPGLLDEGGERGEGWITAGRRPVAAKGNLVEDSLSQPAEPSVERGEVGLPGSGVRPGDGRAVSRMPEVRLREFLDDRDGELLPGEQVGGEHPAAGSAGAAAGERDEDLQLRRSKEDCGPLDEGIREAEGRLAAFIAGDKLQQGLDQAVIFVVDGPRQQGMVDG